jgi:hypothetical protein
MRLAALQLWKSMVPFCFLDTEARSHRVVIRDMIDPVSRCLWPCGQRSTIHRSGLPAISRFFSANFWTHRRPDENPSPETRTTYAPNSLQPQARSCRYRRRRRCYRHFRGKARSRRKSSIPSFLRISSSDREDPRGASRPCKNPSGW